MNKLPHIIKFINEKITHVVKPKEKYKKYDKLYKFLYDNIAVDGHRLDTFADLIRLCFVEAQCHQIRLMFSKTIAEELGIDLLNHEYRKKLWGLAAKEYVLSRTEQSRWYAEDIDRSFNPIITYCNKLILQNGISANETRFAPIREIDLLNIVQTAIIRTLTFIRVFPPKRLTAYQKADEFSETLMRCWSVLKLHDSYKLHKKRSFNQYALDCVYDNPEFRDNFWLNPTELGRLHSWMRNSDINVNETNKIKNFLFSWLLFKYSTFVRIDTENFQGKNPHDWIWDDYSNKSYYKLWGLT